ncbi:hypothetical protein [Sphingopyxis sp. BSNA05]|uniref:hypothetical protein n=1 Tax=Sphingopyxis sp. BSNA05 TaxID=1236614 RepID=UPI0020B69737|nr:hypothetical protein [Sphingopyxis sp. BSNA05]
MATVAANPTESDTAVEDMAKPRPLNDAARAEPAAPVAASAGVSNRSLVNPKLLVASLKNLAAPIIGILAFLALWAVLAPQVDTSLGSLPGPVEVSAQGVALFDEWAAVQEQKAEFYAAQDASNAAALANGGETRNFEYSGPPTFLDQIWTSLTTVALGFSWPQYLPCRLV